MQNTAHKAVKIITIITVTLLFLLSIVLIYQFVKINNLKTQETKLQSTLNTLEQEIVHYSDLNSYLESGNYIEDYAREVLGYGLNGETRFR